MDFRFSDMGTVRLALIALALVCLLPDMSKAQDELPYWRLDLQGGFSIPLSPEGENNFSQTYNESIAPAVGVLYNLNSQLGFGVQGAYLFFPSKNYQYTDFQDIDVNIVGEWSWTPADDSERLYLQAGLGLGMAQVQTSVMGHTYVWNSWNALAEKLAFGYEWKYNSSFGFNAEAAFWNINGPPNADPVGMGTLSLGVRIYP